MTLAPLIPAWAVVLVALVLTGLALAVYRRQLPLLLLRLGALGLLVYALANPVRRDPVADDDTPRELVVVVDCSGSMAEPVAEDSSRSRYQAASDVATELVAELGGSWRLRLVALDDQLRGALPEHPGGDTDLGQLRAIDAFDADAAVLITDGADWQDGAAALPGRLATTIHALGVGAHGTNTNAAVALRAPSPTAFPGQELPLHLAISASDALIGVPARLRLEAIAADGRVTELRSQDLRLERDIHLTVPVAVGETLGSRMWRAELTVGAEEAATADNVAHLSVQVIDQAIQVAVIEGQPYWDTTFALRALRRDRQFAVTSWFGLGQRDYRSGPRSGEVDRILAGEVDVVILGTHVENMLGDEAVTTLLEFVDGGGGLVFLGHGPRPEALSALNPIVSADGALAEVVPEATATGRRLDLLPGGDLPAVGSAPVLELRPQSQVYLGTREQPLLAHRRHGLGWVIGVNADGIWRWRLGRDDDPGSRFWRQLIKGSSREVGGRLRPSRLQYRRGDEAELWITGVDGHGLDALTVTAPSGAQRQIAVSAGRASFVLAEIGTWHVSGGGEDLQLVVNEQLGEQLLTGRDDGVLARIAEATGGSVRDISDAAELAAELAAAPRLGSASRVDEVPLITQAWWLLAMSLLLACEWTVRRRRYGVV